ncbi:MAG TPA: T9SS type A sorting domain-containing protein, partial [Bacteroidia bacterium]|nr:T9SS type A sorting domain-containing protein [Bacteroidia bacterium]
TTIIVSDKNQPDLNVFPNPNKGIFTISNPSLNPYMLRMFDVRGVVVYQQYLQQGSTILNCDFLHPGLYIMQLETDGKTNAYKKIIVND